MSCEYDAVSGYDTTKKDVENSGLVADVTDWYLNANLPWNANAVLIRHWTGGSSLVRK
jgi:hypothetical protein